MKRSDKPSGMTTTGKTREAVIVFFDAVIERRFSDADKALGEVRGKRKANPEFQKGYSEGASMPGNVSKSWNGDKDHLKPF